MRVSGLLTILFCGFDFLGCFVWFWIKKFFVKREIGWVENQLPKCRGTREVKVLFGRRRGRETKSAPEKSGALFV